MEISANIQNLNSVYIMWCYVILMVLFFVILFYRLCRQKKKFRRLKGMIITPDHDTPNLDIVKLQIYLINNDNIKTW